jgi:hypothetical protein
VFHIVAYDVVLTRCCQCCFISQLFLLPLANHLRNAISLVCKSDVAAGCNMICDVRFQVLTAASMMFRVVFWDILPCKMIVDRRFRLLDSYITSILSC